MNMNALRDAGRDSIRPQGSNEMQMLITLNRVIYVGLIGKPQTRELGSLMVYVSLGAPFRIQVGHRDWDGAEMVVVAPNTPHRIATSDRLIGVAMIEPETVDEAGLPEWLQPTGHPQQCAPGLEQVRRAFAALRGGLVQPGQIAGAVDRFLFGCEFEPRAIDPRIAAVLGRINGDPCSLLGAEDYARAIDLSFSRFLHLFKDEVGTTFRSFRAWKRARSFLAYVNHRTSLTDIALDIGYPDSSHFSHTMRRCWGLTPKDIMAGSRRLAVINHGVPQVRQ